MKDTPRSRAPQLSGLFRQPVAFAELLEAEVATEGEYHVVALRPLDTEHSPETLRHEFANYALGRAARRTARRSTSSARALSCPSGSPQHSSSARSIPLSLSARSSARV